MNEYSPWKAAHHRPTLDGIQGRGPIVPPVHVQIYPSDLCNQDCHFCAFRMEGYTVNEMFGVMENGVRNNNPNRMIPSEKFQEIIYDLGKNGVTKAVQFTGGGEPSLHPSLPFMLRYARGLGLSTAVVSNGVKWSAELISELAQCSWVRISVDAGDEETYASTRRVSRSTFQRVLNNITLLRSAAPDLNIGMSFVVTKENWREIGKAAVNAIKVGATNIRYSGFFQPDHAAYFQDFFLQAQECIEGVHQTWGNQVQIFNLLGDRVQDLVQHSPDYERCGVQYYTTVIGGDLNVYRCCNTAYSPQGLLGSIAGMDFNDFWRSEATQQKLRSFDARTCERCMFNQKNRFINYLAEDTPTHSEFV